MSWEQSVDVATGINTFTFAVELTSAEVIEALTFFYRSSGTSTRLSLWDLTGITVRISTDEIRRIATFVTGNAGPQAGRAAIVVAQDLGFGLGRMYASMVLGSPVESRVFRDHNEALEWLREVAPSG